MERIEGPQTPFEVYCYDCRVTFPVGTRRCVHCGLPHGRQRVQQLSETHHVAFGGEDGEAPTLSMGRRMGSAALWVLLVVGAALARLCDG